MFVPGPDSWPPPWPFAGPKIKELATLEGWFPLAAVTEVMAPVTAMAEAGDKIRINQAPVLTLWAVVAERLDFDRGDRADPRPGRARTDCVESMRNLTDKAAAVGLIDP
jgi:hypothetical protein